LEDKDERRKKREKSCVKCKPMLCLQARLHGAKVQQCGACTTRERQPNDDRGW
jgi:hypothetical protein